VKDRRIAAYEFALIPVLSDAILPDPDMTALIKEIRSPHEAMLTTELARTDHLLYRRGNFGGTLDDVICAALIEERDAELSFSPGFRWGASLLPRQAITWDDVYNATAMTYPNVYRVAMRGNAIKAILEDVADNLFNADPYYQQGGDMVRTGGLGYTIKVDQPIGRRIHSMTLLKTGQPIEAARDYIVAGWASVQEGTQGPPVWDLVAHYLQRRQVVVPAPFAPVNVVRG
jgi:sulfur-oxidizing protein SoxB